MAGYPLAVLLGLIAVVVYLKIVRGRSSFRPKTIYTEYIIIFHYLKEVVKSYEIEFIGEREVASILKEALRTDSRIESFEELENGFRLKLAGARRKITIVCRGDATSRKCMLIVNSSKIPENGGIALDADKIAKKCGSKPEIAMLGAIAKLGVVELKHLMRVIYRDMGYGDVLAVKKGFEAIKI